MKISVGQRFGSLIVIAVVPGTRAQPRRIKCLCDCGSEYLAIPHRLNCGGTVRCFQCLPKRRTKDQIAFRRRFNNYQHSSIRKNLSFNFTQDQFRYFYDAACSYCGIVPAQGIDRRDNSLGYVQGNCVPSCAQCNYAKRNMSETAFIGWISRLAAFQGFSL